MDVQELAEVAALIANLKTLPALHSNAPRIPNFTIDPAITQSHHRSSHPLRKLLPALTNPTVVASSLVMWR
ncbi:hypothetical protein A0H81_10372 [Grifola frondosa]|uniref:Uncharacterized protein n=1 Tax=Grifola frondosa TaxID=5627 RepID=A0A1C7M0B8_GRIFR|nr:hypothetical protein A0H81_10372 [Grifola frondosa]